VRSDKSDWYRVTSVTYSGAQWVLRLDRPYAGPGLDITGQVAVSVLKNDVIATNSLVETFTTMLGSQLADTNTTGLTYP
jgi:hypothetical protein